MTYKGMSGVIDFDSLVDPNTRFELLEIIGEGTYGEIYAAKDHEAGTVVAVKVIENIAENLEEIEEEYLVLRDLCLHPNIPSFFGIFMKRGKCREEEQIWMAMELCSRGSVTDLVQGLMKRGQKLTEEQISYIVKETLFALAYLHDNRCMHRDIKGHNILLTSSGQIKLIDFGVSSHLESTWAKQSTSVGTPYWMAPEVIACEQQLDCNYDVRCDIWSLGITAIELADGDPPFSEIHPMRALFQIPRNPPPILKRPSEWSKEFNDFISECLAKDYEERPSAQELLEHPFVKDFSNNTTKIRQELVELSEDLKQRNESVTKKAEMTVKGGALKPDRKTKRTPLWMDDLACLEKLSEEIIVEHLKKRYELDTIYTYIGDILIAVNPFKELPIYGEKESQIYRGLVKCEGVPHIFAMADSAYHAMLHLRIPQCIVISGESGAGKTESSNFLIKHLVSLGMAPNGSLEDKILLINPIMEAFGNARTGINDNSSRFGKYLELSFTKLGRVTGAKMSVYLLEQSRVVYQQDGEQNFHIFYYLQDGLEAEDKLEQYSLEGNRREKPKYLSGPNWNKVKSEDNVKQFKKVVDGFRVLGFEQTEIDSIYRILSAIINIGDVAFYQTIDKDNIEQAAVKNVNQIKVVSELLGVEATDLTESLTSNSVVTKGETISRNNSVEEAQTARDAMAKALYGRLFDWIVNKINRLLSLGRTAMGNEGYAVGVLDIFGFENFVTNSFEQLCINIANEQIQYFFNQHIFTWEQQEYMAEGVEVDIIQFADNRPVLDMFLAKPVGLLALLDEESRFPQATDLSLVEKFHSNIKSKFYIPPKGQSLDFTVRHFAGKVIYSGAKFLEKNRNFLCTEIIHLLRGSEHEIIRFLFQSPLTKTGNLYYESPRSSPKPPDFPKEDEDDSRTNSPKYDSRGLASQTKAQQTVGTYFRYSLMDLLQKMMNGRPHFIRCIKPNDDKAPNRFNEAKVERQLRYAGVMETVRIRQHGFSNRIPFSEFLKRYCFLAFSFDERVVASKANCRLLLLRLKMDGWAIGRTKVFLKYYHVEYLTKIYEKQIQQIIKVQACVRRWLAKVASQRKEWNLVSTALGMQSNVQDFLVRERCKSIFGGGASQIQDEIVDRRLSAQLVEDVRRASMLSTIGISLDVKDDVKDFEEEENEANITGNSLTLPKEKSYSRNSLEKKDAAAVVIQSHFRGYKTRSEWGPVLEERLKKLVEDNIDDMGKATKELKKEGLTEEEAALVIQKFWGRKNANVGTKRNAAEESEEEDLEDLEQAQQFHDFTDKVRISNQNVHMILRKNQSSIRLEDLGEAPSNYKRPKGFEKIPRLIDEGRKSGSKIQAFYRPKMKNHHPKNSASVYYDMIQENYKRDSYPPVNSKRDLLNETLQAINKPVLLQVPSSSSAPKIEKKQTHASHDDVRRLLRATSVPPMQNVQRSVEPHSQDLEGPFQFQKMLRKTNYAPTDSLRKRREDSQRINH